MSQLTTLSWFTYWSGREGARGFWFLRARSLRLFRLNRRWRRDSPFERRNLPFRKSIDIFVSISVEVVDAVFLYRFHYLAAVELGANAIELT